MIATDNKDFLI